MNQGDSQLLTIDGRSSTGSSGVNPTALAPEQTGFEDDE